MSWLCNGLVGMFKQFIYPDIVFQLDSLEPVLDCTALCCASCKV